MKHTNDVIIDCQSEKERNNREKPWVWNIESFSEEGNRGQKVKNLFWMEVKEAMEDNLESLILPESV